MSLTSNELNYLIWRYLQEGGLDVSAYALQDETHVDEYETRYGSKVPLGCLVDLVQKGILYTKVNELVSSDETLVPEKVVNLDFNLFGALAEEDEAEKNGRKLNKGGKSEEEPVPEVKPLQSTYSFPASLACEWNPLQNILAYGQRDPNAAIATMGETTTVKVLPHPVSAKQTLTLSWNPDGRSLVTASENGELRMWDVSGSIRFIMALHHSSVITMKWSPNTNHLVTLDVSNKAIVWDTQTGQPVQHVDGTAPAATLNGTCACWIDDFKFVVPARDHTLQVFQLGDVSQQPVGVLSGHSDCVTFVSYNTHLKLLCSASDDRTIRVWRGNSTNSLQVLLGHSQPITYLNWLRTPQDKWYLVSCSLDSSLRVWDFYKGITLDLKVVSQGLPILTACTSHNYSMIATADSSGSVLVWKLTDKMQYVQIYSYSVELKEGSLISTVRWSADDSELAISCSDSSSEVVRVSEPAAADGS